MAKVVPISGPAAPTPEESLARADHSELAALGGCLWSLAGLDTVFEILTPEDFYDGMNRVIARALLHLRDTGRWTPDTVALHDLLLARGEFELPGMVTRLGLIVNNSTTDEPEVLRTYAFAVAEASARRQLARLTRDAHEGSGTRDAAETVGLIQQRLDAIENRTATANAVSARTLAKEVMDRVEGLATKRLTQEGTRTGFAALDNLTNGFQPADLVLLAARPSVGKTAFALNMMTGAMQSGGRVVMFSMEMPRASIMQRILSSLSGVSLFRIRRGEMFEHDWSPLSRASAEIGTFDLLVDDRAGLSVADMRTVARRQRAMGPLALVVVDYLQLARGTSDENRNQEVSSISRGLKALAKELAVPVLALSQFNRDSEKSGGRPKLVNLRDSGALEQDADLVLLLHREDITNRLDRKAELIVAKHRNGETGLIELEFNGAVQRFNEVPGQAPPEEAALPPAEVWS